MADSVRIDKYLWAIRAFKTRSEAADACKGGKVKIADVPAKPSRPVKEGEIISVRKGAVTYTYRVVKPTENRVGAALVPNFADNLTPEEELVGFGGDKDHFALFDGNFAFVGDVNYSASAQADV